VYHNPFATHELDPRVFFEKGVSQHWYDPQSGLPSDNTEDGSLIQRFCIKLLTKGKNVSKTSLGKTKEILKNIEPKPKPSK
jgi:hypothetical protein